ncbi:alanine--tRNA ligase [Natronospora cellulosivora (SeqCode)]
MVMTGNEVRKAYLDFFEEKGHLVLASAPLIPQNDPSILWINAGMAPFKNYFNGIETPPRDRVATSQKCIRTNDIENVGKTDRHHTFFEMLGNFSFGDYFKKEAITWAWEFITEVLKMEEERLWITVYQDDDEAFNIWHNDVGVPKERILRMGKKDNFWEIGTGPCGPCSEIHYDRGIEYGDSEEDVIGGEGDRFLEIWNLVFTQYDKKESGEYELLKNKNIDTGMGLERVASILQGVDSNFETDLLKPMIDFLESDSGFDYSQDDETKTTFRVIADHSRGASMAIFDGALPSNEGRGYVIRRIIRRAVRFGKNINYKEPFLYKLVPVVIETMKEAYPELQEKAEYLQKVIKAEEERFLLTLDQGLIKLNDMIEELKNEGQELLSGENAFKLYDTYGFPLDLTNDVLEEEGLTVDENGFEAEMEKQRQRARDAREDVGFNASEQEIIYRDVMENNGDIEFTGYEHYEDKSKIISIISEGKEVESLSAGKKGEIILDSTPFYAESGGQVGDKGILRLDGNLAKVYDTKKRLGLIVHYIEVEEGRLNKNQEVEARVYSDIRKATARNHSATHLLHKALKEVLGDHVKQAGSLVEADRLRFDFNHFNKMNDDEIAAVEAKVNQAIMSNLSVKTLITSMDEAREAGVTALFGEKYGEKVRVVSMGDYSKELCAGTHVQATGEIGFFKILSESSVAAGVRRIEAISGEELINFINKQENLIASIADKLKTTEDKLMERIDTLILEQKELEKEMNSLKDRLANSTTGDLIDEVEEINGVSIITTSLDGIDNEALRKLSDQLKEKLGSGIIVLASNLGEKVLFVASVTDDLVKEGYHAGKIVSKVAKVAGGGGGGRPDMAQAGARDSSKIQEALKEAKKLL